MTQDPQKLANFIGGEYCAPASDRYFENFNPATGAVYSLVPDSDGSDIARAVAAAKAAFPAWAAKKPAERGAVLQKIADILDRRRAEFAKAESIDQGKTYRQAFDLELPRALRNFRFFAEYLQTEHKLPTIVTEGEATNQVVRAPVGVAGLISPWNLPLYLITWKIAPALAAGNTAVCKPSELTPMTAYMLGEVFREAGLPPGVCNIVLGLGSKAGEALVTHPDVRLISFTGGTATGTHIASQAGAQLKRLSLELGGKNPGIVFADADLEASVATSLNSSFRNQGEICLCNSRLYVEAPIYNEFVDRLVEATKKIKAGDPMSPDSFLGPLVSEQHREKVLSYIELAKSEGATIHCGGGIPKLPAPFDNGYFVEPTVITGVKPDSRVQQEEIFGPVVTITPFTTEAEALKLANDTKYGLSASVFTRDTEKAKRIALGIEAGTVWINTWMLRELRAPFGGAKASGIGREGGEYSFDFYTEMKNVCTKM